MKTPIRLICNKVSEAEWFYENYKHVFFKIGDAEKMLKKALKKTIGVKLLLVMMNVVGKLI